MKRALLIIALFVSMTVTAIAAEMYMVTWNNEQVIPNRETNNQDVYGNPESPIQNILVNNSMWSLFTSSNSKTEVKTFIENVTSNVKDIKIFELKEKNMKFKRKNEYKPIVPVAPK